MDYIPTTPEQRDPCCKTIGVDSIEELFADIPETLRLKDGSTCPRG